MSLVLGLVLAYVLDWRTVCACTRRCHAHGTNMHACSVMFDYCVYSKRSCVRNHPAQPVSEDKKLKRNWAFFWYADLQLAPPPSSVLARTSLSKEGKYFSSQSAEQWHCSA